jgi:hypothetical protein
VPGQCTSCEWTRMTSNTCGAIPGRQPQGDQAGRLRLVQQDCPLNRPASLS